MFLKNINKFSKEKAVLVVPLDWGLGHATRCIPLIHHLQSKGLNVIVGAEGSVQSLLQHEFQQLTFLPLPGYRVKYIKNRSLLPLAILLQVPRILSTIYREHKWVKKIAEQFELGAIISDNRFGLFHPTIRSVFITHQLAIKTGNSLSDRLTRSINFRFIKKFSQCWVPDFEGAVNIAGELSHPAAVPPNTQYIGGLSRFTNVEVRTKKGLLVLLSGPEPQRTIFEQVILKQLDAFKGDITLVRGLPGNTEPLLSHMTRQGVKVVNHLAAEELGIAISSAEWVICRSGYTTVMDLLKLRQKAILVPTPGQREQEYLARYLEERCYFFSSEQAGFDLRAVLRQAMEFKFIFPEFDMELYKKKLDQFVETLQSDQLCPSIL